MKHRFVSFEHLGKLVHRANFTPDTRALVADRFADTLAGQYPKFNTSKFLVACLTGKVERTFRKGLS